MSPTQVQDRTKATYGLQWNRFRIVRPEEDRATFLNHTGLRPGDLAGAIVLDAGCGMGRYLRVASEFGAKTVVGLDLSEAVQAARDLTRDLPSILVVRGDLTRPPFPDGSFDQIYSLGVIDHTPNPEKTFQALVPLLKPGGRIVIWVYPRERPIIETIMNLQRGITTRLPLSVLLALCRILAPIGGLKRRLASSRCRLIERCGVALHLATIGVSMHPDPEVRVCDTLDWYAPKYLSRHTPQEVMDWFNRAGLVAIEDLGRNPVFYHAGQGRGVNIAGRKPGKPLERLPS